MDLLNSKKQNKKQEEGLFGALLAHLATSLVQPVVFEKYKNTCKYLNYVEQLLFLVSTGTGCVSISAFDSLVATPVGLSSAVGIKIGAITEGIKKYKSIIKEMMKEYDKIALLEKYKLNTIEVLIPEALIDSYIVKTNLFQ